MISLSNSVLRGFLRWLVVATLVSGIIVPITPSVVAQITVPPVEVVPPTVEPTEASATTSPAIPAEGRSAPVTSRQSER